MSKSAERTPGPSPSKGLMKATNRKPVEESKTGATSTIIADTSELDSYLWPYSNPLPNSVVLSRGLDERIFQMPYSLLKKSILEWHTKQLDTEIAKARKQWLQELTVWANTEMANDWVKGEEK